MTKIENYVDFLNQKKKQFHQAGFAPSNYNPTLFPFQKHCTGIALNKGRFALFEDCGLGKTIQELEWSRQVAEHTKKQVLNLSPLAVAGQTIKEGEKFGIEIKRWSEKETCPVVIANYEQLHKIDCSKFSGIVLDESSILKNFTGKNKEAIINAFASTPYKLACTATPSPNDHMELCNHAEFLNVMSREEMLSMYFVHDGGETSKWRLKKHAEKRFWEFVSSWAIMINRPSDIGFSDEGFILPELNINEIQIETGKRDNGLLFNDVAVSATNFNQELRLTITERVETAVEMVNRSNDTWLVWCKQNVDSEQLTEKINDAVEVRGSMSDELKEERLLGFARGKYKCMVTKPKIAQYGLNYQNCHNQIFTALDFSFESLYQAIRRSYRFGQKHPVNIWLITTDTMTNVIKAIKDKQNQFEEMKNNMIKFQISYDKN